MSLLGLSFSDRPQWDFKLVPCHTFDCMLLPQVKQLLNDVIGSALGIMIRPQEYKIALADQDFVNQSYLLWVRVREAKDLMVKSTKTNTL